jgi:hypothetical protein
VPFYEVAGVKNGIDLKQYINLIKTSSPAIQVPLTNGDMTSVLPSSVLFLPIDKAAVDKANFVPAALKPLMKDTCSGPSARRISTSLTSLCSI